MNCRRTVLNGPLGRLRPLDPERLRERTHAWGSNGLTLGARTGFVESGRLGRISFRQSRTVGESSGQSSSLVEFTVVLLRRWHHPDFESGLSKWTHEPPTMSMLVTTEFATRGYLYVPRYRPKEVSALSASVGGGLHRVNPRGEALKMPLHQTVFGTESGLQYRWPAVYTLGCFVSGCAQTIFVTRPMLCEVRVCF